MLQACLGSAAGFAMPASIGWAHEASAAGPYKTLRTAKVDVASGSGYVDADVVGCRLHIACTGLNHTRGVL